MNKILPDKHIRKALSLVLNNVIVNGQPIKCYTARVTGPHIPDNYIILSTQTNTVDKSNKCAWRWESSILLDVFTTYPRHGNTGSKVDVDDILNEVRAQANSFELDVASGLTIVTRTMTFPNDITDVGDDEIVNRKFLRLELLVN